jgi:hypothetical protein
MVQKKQGNVTVWSIGKEFRCQRNWAALESLILQNSIGLYVLDGNGTNGRTTTSHGCNYRSWLAWMNKPYFGPAPLSLLEMELRPNFGTTAGCTTRALGRWRLTCTDWHGGKHHRRQSHGLEKLDERTLASIGDGRNPTICDIMATYSLFPPYRR